eukprot:15476464-Alexandrium_andersonii.AAC.1
MAAAKEEAGGASLSETGRKPPILLTRRITCSGTTVRSPTSSRTSPRMPKVGHATHVIGRM